jgi:hypothetical protein
MESLLLPSTDLINQQFESLGLVIGDNLLILELYIGNKNDLDPIKVRKIIDHYAEDIDHRLTLCKSKLITDILDLNSRLLSEV